MATITVTTLDDTVANDGQVSLREALQAANTDTTVDGVTGAGADTIVFAAALAGNTLTLTNGTLTVSTAAGLTINGDVDGDGAPDITVSGGGTTNQVFNIAFGAHAALNGLVVSDGFAPGAYSGAGIFVNSSAVVTIADSVISDNVAGNQGGGIWNAGILTLLNTTVSGNEAGFVTPGNGGGGIINTASGNLTLVNSTLSDNHSGTSGGGLTNFGTATLVNTTFALNSAGTEGGAVATKGSGVLTLLNGTITGNSAGTFGGGLWNENILTFDNTIVVGNGNGGDPGANNLASASGATIFFSSPNIDAGALTDIFASVVSVDPDGAGGVAAFNAGKLADNGGLVETVAIKVGGTAHNVGSNAVLPADTKDIDGDANTAETLPLDAHGGPRIQGASVDLGAFEVGLTVTTLDDELDAADTNLATANLGDLSLREALAIANSNANQDDISFAANLAGGTLVLTNDELTISSNLTITGDIDGDKVADITISGNNAIRVFNIASGQVSLGSLAIRDGYSSAGGAIIIQGGANVTIADSVISGSVAHSVSGGGILNAGTLTLVSSTVSGNTSVTDGGGIENTGTITILNSTFSDNRADNEGGGFSNFGGTAVVTNTTFFGNTAIYAGGGAIDNEAILTLTNVTISGNSAGNDGGGISNNASLTLANSIVTGNKAGVTGDNISGGYSTPATSANFVGDTFTSSGAGSVSGYSLSSVFASVVEVDPDGPGGLAPFLAGELADNGGRVQTIALNPDIGVNPALDTGETDFLDEATVSRDLNGDGDTTDTITTDARGFNRNVDAGLSPHTLDLGAFEQQNAATFIVTTIADETFDGGDLAAELADGGGLSLREAIALANLDPTMADVINFAVGLSGQTIFLTTGQELKITSSVTINGDIDGDNAADITVDANSSAGADDAASRVFNIDGGGGSADVTLNGLVIQNGVTTGIDEDGGGILVGDGDALTLTNATVRNNTSSSDGGGISSNGSLVLTNSTISGNSAADNGGGVDIDEGGVTMTNVTVTGNTALYAGGGVHIDDGNSTLTDVTITGNSGSIFGGGLSIISNGDTTIVDSTIDGNTAVGYGGGIYADSNGTLAISGSTISGNLVSGLVRNFGYISIAYGYGGGIAADIDLTITNSTISGNSVAGNAAGGAYTFGGGIATQGTALLVNTTVSGNTTGYAGGGIANNGDLTLINTTIANNSAIGLYEGLGGGIYQDSSFGSLHIYSSTITGNVADEAGGGIYDCGCATYMSNSIVLGNTADNDPETTVVGSLYGVNIIGTSTYTGTTATGTTSVAAVFAAVDPLTGGGLLANNGGPVQTVLIKANGDAHNTGDNSELPADLLDLDGDTDSAEALPVDARGEPRTFDTTVDLGAVELQLLRNDQPTVALTNTLTSLAENASTASARKVADIVVTDDGRGTNILSLSGADAALFEITAGALFLKAGVTLDFETKPVLDVTVEVDDTTIGGTPDATASLSVHITDVAPNAVADSFTLPDDVSRFSGNLLGNDTEVTSVTAVDGSAAGVGSSITLASGAFLTLNADGTFTYDPNGKFEHLPAGTTATETFSYTVTDGTTTDTATVTLTITGIDNDDVYTGTGGADRIDAGRGNDTVRGLGGDDRLVGGVGRDTLDGGTGNDKLLGGGDKDHLIGGPGNDYLDGGTNDDLIEGGAGNDRLIGGANNDTLIGGSGKDRLEGNAGQDRLEGGAGNDTLDGGTNKDTLIGGRGRDLMTGGSSADTFVFLSINNSAPNIAGLAGGVFSAAVGAGKRDIIFDFAPGLDKIDVSAIDADTHKSGNQVFTWISTDTFSGDGAELRFQKFNPAGTASDRTIIYGDADGDGKAEFQIELRGLKALTAGDFTL